MAPVSDDPFVSNPFDPRAPANACTSRFAVGCPEQFAINCTDQKVLEFIEAGTAPSTRRAYQADLAHFVAWGGTLPATPLVVARYLADHATTLAMATLARRLVAVGLTHTRVGFANPTTTDLVRLTFRGIRRTYGAPQRRVAALTNEEIITITSLLGDSIRDVRDRALLLIGFSGAFRRSELSAVDCKSIEWMAQGLVLTIPRNKTDQEGRGRKVAIPLARVPACPVRALGEWLELSGIKDGPIFRPVAKGGNVLPKRLSPDAVAAIVKRSAKAAGLDPKRYSGHSLRAGFVTSAAAIGMPVWKIKAQTGHASDAMLSRYIRASALVFSGADDAIL